MSLLGRTDDALSPALPLIQLTRARTRQPAIKIPSAWRLSQHYLLHMIMKDPTQIYGE
jgi:hypothetical protein